MCQPGRIPHRRHKPFARASLETGTRLRSRRVSSTKSTSELPDLVRECPNAPAAPDGLFEFDRGWRTRTPPVRCPARLPGATDPRFSEERPTAGRIARSVMAAGLVHGRQRDVTERDCRFHGKSPYDDHRGAFCGRDFHRRHLRPGVAFATRASQTCWDRRSEGMVATAPYNCRGTVWRRRTSAFAGKQTPCRFARIHFGRFGRVDFAG